MVDWLASNTIFLEFGKALIRGSRSRPRSPKCVMFVAEHVGEGGEGVMMFRANPRQPGHLNVAIPGIVDVNARQAG